ncbi:MAG: hypothetical protein FJY11_03805 [Bacteroidetes bacterium]|nr:hypothetical protein [Bacteroidota bacterium]
MKTPSLILFVLIFLVLISCKSPSVHYSDFQTTKNIQFDEHKVSILLGMPMDMLVVNDLVIVLDQQTDMFFHLFSIDSFNHLGSFIRKGRGPGEEVFISPFFKIHADDEIIYQSESDLKVARIFLSGDSANMVILRKIDLPAAMREGVDFFLVNNKIFTSNYLDTASRDFSVYDMETGQMSEWGESYFFSDKSIPQYMLAFNNAKLTTVNSKENLIASVFNQFPLLRIYSLETEQLIAQLQMSDASHNREVMLTGQGQPGTGGKISYYHHVSSTDDYIYGLYGGFSVMDRFKEGEEPFYYDWSEEVHIWKWDGTPVMKLRFNRAVSSFDVTPDNKKIIATSIVDTDKLFEAVIPWD